MKHTRGRIVEVETEEELAERLARGASNLSGWQLIGLDLGGFADRLAQRRVAGAVFLGCRLPDQLELWLREQGAFVFPELPGAPVDAYRTTLYTPDELYDATGYPASTDARAYAWSIRAPDRGAELIRSLHDHAVDEALADWVRGRSLVGVMGGHALRRGDVGYRDAVRLAHGLADRHTVATGGGPGAMEAANLGAWLTATDAVDEVIELLATVPDFRPDIGAWATAGFEVRDRWPDGRESLGIPTWFYGHEPPNVFASTIAKYFKNALRETILLQVCGAGIVFLPGAGGTVQEVFQDGCENYYADESSVAPMILVGREHWTVDVPAWPLLRQLARGRPMESHVHLVDTVDEAIALAST